MSSAEETSLQQFERIEKQVAAESSANSQQTRNPLANMSQNSSDQPQQRQQPSIHEVDDEEEEVSLQLPPHEEFARQGEGGGGGVEGSDLPLELSYQRLLLNSPSTGSNAQTNSSRPPSGEATTQATNGPGNERRRSTANVGTMTANGGGKQRLAASIGTTTSATADEEERERRKEMIDRANSLLPRAAPTATGFMDERNGRNGSSTTEEFATPIPPAPPHQRLFGAAAAGNYSTSPSSVSSSPLFAAASADYYATKTPSPLIPSPAFFQRRHRHSSATKTPSTLLAPLKVPDFKQAELHPPPVRQGGGGGTRPMFQSTPHQQTQQQAAPPPPTSAGKSKRPTTPGGRPISPIAEETDLERMVAEVVDNGGGGQQQKGGVVADQRVLKSLVTQLRDLIAQWDWAQARHRHVAKIYFERQNEELDARWNQLSAEITKFNEQKADEWAQIAKVRSELHAERVKKCGKKDADRIKELEQEVVKLKSKEALSSQRVSELRTRIRELEGEVRVREQSYTDNMLKIKKVERQLVTAEQENSNLRTRLTLMRAEAKKQQQMPTTTSSSTQPQQPQVPGPRATLFNLLNGTGNRNRGSSSTNIQNGGMRRNNSDSTFAASQQQLQNGTAVGKVHRSNSDGGGAAGFQQSNGRQRVVRFAEPMLSSSSSNNTVTLGHAIPAAADQSVLATALATSNDISGAALNKRFDIPAGMMNTMYRITGRGREYTFTGDSADKQLVVTELMACRGGQQQQQRPPCLLYEWPAERNFRWINGGGGQQNNCRRIQIDYRDTERQYEVRMPRGHLLRFLLDGQLELIWACGDRTLVLPDGERREIYNPEQPNFRIEIFMPTGIAYRLDAQTQWQREEFAPDPARMSARPDGSYVAEYVEDLGGDDTDRTDQRQRQAVQQQQQRADEGRLPRSSLQINSPDFQLRRFADTRAVKLALDKWAGGIQLWLCVDNVLLVKHVDRPSNGGGGGENEEVFGGPAQATSSSASLVAAMKKRVCFSHGQCRHINTGS